MDRQAQVLAERAVHRASSLHVKHCAGHTVLAPGPPQQLTWSWHATEVTAPQVHQVHPLGPPFRSHLTAGGGLMIQFWPMRCKQKSGSWAGLLRSLCLPAEKGHSQLTDPSILHHSHSCGHQNHSWYGEAQPHLETT